MSIFWEIILKVRRGDNPSGNLIWRGTTQWAVAVDVEDWSVTVNETRLSSKS